MIQKLCKMPPFMYACVCTHKSTHTHTHTRTYTHTHSHTHTHTHTLSLSHTHTHTHTHTHSLTHTHTHSLSLSDTQTHTHTHKHKYQIMDISQHPHVQNKVISLSLNMHIMRGPHTSYSPASSFSLTALMAQGYNIHLQGRRCTDHFLEEFFQSSKLKICVPVAILPDACC